MIPGTVDIAQPPMKRRLNLRLNLGVSWNAEHNQQIIVSLTKSCKAYILYIYTHITIAQQVNVPIMAQVFVPIIMNIINT